MKIFLRSVALIVLGVVLQAARLSLAEDVIDYKISPLDLLLINVYGEKDLSGEFKVSPKGEVTVHLVGKLKLAGLTTSEAEDLLKEKLGEDYLRDPQVIVAVKDHAKRFVSVYGQVNRPQTVEMTPERPMSLIEAIANAGGPNGKAKVSDVQVTRAGEEQTQTLHFDLDKMRKVTDPKKIFYVQAGDSIFVPESTF
ncbi:MAG: polysaccharide export protein [Verrucomicrobia bacterium]|nr:polysaccharide export protein [Verrucomicrobiota bacterium]